MLDKGLKTIYYYYSLAYIVLILFLYFLLTDMLYIPCLNDKLTGKNTMKKFYLKSKNGVPNEVILMDDVIPPSQNIESLTDYETFKLYDSGQVKFSPFAEYKISNLMKVPAMPETIITAIPNDGKKITVVNTLYQEKAA